MLIVNLYTGPKCNLDCEYCFDQTKPKRRYVRESLDVDAIIKFLDSLGIDIYINLVGGEPFLAKGTEELIIRATQRGWYLALFTNLTAPVDRIVKEADTGRILFNCSFHYRELVRTCMLDKFVVNYNKLKKVPTQYLAAEEVAYPEYTEEDISAMESEMSSKGVDLVFTAFRGTYKGKVYPASYNPNQIEYFRIQKDIDYRYSEERKNSKGTHCSATKDHIFMDTEGNIAPCTTLYFNSDIRLGNMYKGDFKINPDGIICSADSCLAPVAPLDQLKKETVCLK